MSDLPEPDETARTIESALPDRERRKYRLHSELARGGMGVVLRGHDRELGRDVAIKVLDPDLAEREEVRQRFVEEAQIGGQLQHPGIVPVYELGLMADERPWFAMKLVKGRTLAELLAERASTDAERGKLLSIFEDVCQTVAYAHSKSVIHRDLKPANVMVGAFGEVQVVDWGLAKVLGNETKGKPPAPTESILTVIETVRSKEGSSHGSASLAGSVLGTPAYMPPEQAQGNIDRLDARADVFALGAILCEILTGEPPYVAGDEGLHVLELAADGDLEPALDRIARASADDELKELCRRCLAPGRGSRPKDAGEVADAMHSYVVGSEERAHRAELEAAEQKLNAERSARRVQVTLMAAGLVLLLVVGRWWMERQEERRSAELSRAFGEAQPEILAASGSGDFVLALELAQAARRMVEAGEPSDQLRERADEAVEQAERRLREDLEREAEEQRLAEFSEFLEYATTNYAEEREQEIAAFEAGFEAFGIVPEDPDLDDVLAPYRDTELGIRIARAFDAWARNMRLEFDTDSFRVELLTGLGLDLDPDPVRADVRRALAARDVSVLLDLYESLDLDSLPAETLHAIGSALREFGRDLECANVLSRGALRYPSYFLLVNDAGMANRELRNHDQARKFLSSAVALRPEDASAVLELGDTCRALGDFVDAKEFVGKAVELNPDGNWNYDVIGRDAWFLGRWADSIELFEREETVASEVGKLSAQVYGGLVPLEQGLTEITAAAEAGYEATGAKIVCAGLLTVVPDGVEPDPERALAFVDSVDRRGDALLFDTVIVAAVHARLGNGADVLRALEPYTERIANERVDDRYFRALSELMLAVGHSLVGDDDRAAYHHGSAKHSREHLVAGREDAWSESWMEMVFQQFEPMID